MSSPSMVARLESLNAIAQNIKNKDDIRSSSLILSIDFGTTYSGVGYVFTSNPENIRLVNKWPGLAGTTSPKVPTIIRYTSPTTYTWGFEIGPSEDKRIEAFKLLLDPTLPKPLNISMTKIQSYISEFSKTSVDVVRDFITSLYHHALTAIEEAHPREFLEILDVKYVVSVPSGWPENATDAIIKAAKDAHIDPILQIHESESAALFAIKSKASSAADLKVRDTIIICDAGGATVDINSYEIKKLEPLILFPVVAPSVGLAGSLDLNRAFENHVRKSLYDEEEFFPLKKTAAFNLALKQFENEIKPDFSSSNNREYSVKFPGAKLTDEPTGNLQNNVMTLTVKDVEKIFQPVVDEACRAVSAHIDQVLVKQGGINRDSKSIKAVFLVGGFGSNIHLYERLKAKDPRLQYIQPKDAWTATIKGSLLHFIPQRNVAQSQGSCNNGGGNRASCHYGIACSPIWTEENFPHEPKYWDSWEGVWRCTSIDWLIKKGESLSHTRRITRQCYRQCGAYPDDGELAIKIELKKSSAAETPTSSTDGSISSGRFLNVALSVIPQQYFKKKSRPSDHEKYWELFYEFVLEVKDNRLAMWIEVDGNEYGRVMVW